MAIDRSAWVIFFAERPQTGGLSRWPVSFTIGDESGEVLGRLQGASWFAVERPPGVQWFYTGSERDECVGSDERGSMNIGVLRAELERGRIYFIRAYAQAARRSIRRQLEIHRAGCCDMDGSVELVGVRPGGSEWRRLVAVLDSGVRLQAAPRGVIDPAGAELLDRGRRRIGRCIDQNRSRLDPEDGATRWPLDPSEPSLDHVPDAVVGGG